MKSSLGTLAAVAALAVAATTTASASVQYATHLFGDVIDPYDSTYIDINNDGIADYEVLNGNRLMGVHFTFNEVAVSGTQLQNFAFGDTIDSLLDYSPSGLLNLSTSSIVGLRFYIDEDIHYAWLQFGFDEGDMIILNGAWETIANTSLEIAAVPEPTTVAAGIALLAGAAALLRRRTKRDGSRSASEQ